MPIFVRMSARLKRKLRSNDSTDHVNEFGKSVGFVSGLVDYGTCNGPEVNVYWIPGEQLSGLLRYSYHPDDLDYYKLVKTDRPANKLGKRIMRVSWRWDNPKKYLGALDELYHLQMPNGSYKYMKNVPGNGQYVPGVDEIILWYKKLGVTHVETTYGYHDEMPDGVYTLAKFSRWLRKTERESLDEME